MGVCDNNNIAHANVPVERGSKALSANNNV